MPSNARSSGVHRGTPISAFGGRRGATGLAWDRDTTSFLFRAALAVAAVVLVAGKIQMIHERWKNKMPNVGGSTGTPPPQR
jgi:hypothetical protein